MEAYQFSQGRRLRCGYTTGSCAAAAAKAAAQMLFTQYRVDAVRIATPRGIFLDLEPLEAEFTPEYAACAIRKDAGDDPDDTDGVLVYAKAEKTQGSELEICGGIGVGRVTKAGLACAVGGPAINPVPRSMILAEVRQVMQAHDYDGGLRVTISIPAGLKLAEKTFNPRLGIVGGLSVLGTSGIVEPMSEKALIETMYVELRAQKAQNTRDLLVFFGNYGEDFSRDVLRLDLAHAVTCSNFVGELLDYAVYCGFRSLLLIGHSGKLIKLAQGVMNTHSKYADCRTELLALQAMLHGATRATGQEIYACLTTDAAVKVLCREKLLEPVMRAVTERIDFYMQHRVHGKIKTAALMFSNVYGILGKTAGADELLQLHTGIRREKEREMDER